MREERKRRPHRPLRVGAPDFVLAGVTCFSALALGGAHVYVVLASVGFVGAAGWVAYSRGALRSLPAPSVVFGLLAAYTLLQSVPLPLPLLKVLSPHCADVWERALLPVGHTLEFGSLSLDPGASSVEAAKWAAYAVAFAMAASLSKRAGATPVVFLVFVSALLVAIATLGHALAGATRVFGIYDPRLGVGEGHIGPILNSNALAGYLVLGCLCGFGMMLSARDGLLRWLWAGGAGMLATAAVLAGSRGGAVALFLALLGLGACLMLLRDTRVERAKPQIIAAIAGALITGSIFAILGGRDAWAELKNHDLSKLRMGLWILPLLKHYPLFGVGRGAFESTFPEYKQTSDNIVYANPENIVAQWLSEWGVPVAVGSALALVWLSRPAPFRLSRHAAAAVALVGVAAVVLQNCVDFSLELFGPAIAVTLIVGACWGFRREPGGKPRARDHSTLLTLAGTSLCLVLAIARGRAPVALERVDVQQAYQGLDVKDNEAVDRFQQQLRASILRHPAEPYFPRVAALVSLRSGDDNAALSWISRALERAPVDSRTHWILANALARRGHVDQALLEARLAVEYDPDMAEVVGKTVVRWSSTLEDIKRAAPKSSVGAKVKLFAAGALPVSQGNMREELIREAIAQDPRYPGARMALARELLPQLRSDDPARARELIAAADAIDRLSPDSADASELRARIYARTGQFAQGKKMLEARCPALKENEQVRCWRALLDMASEAKDSALVAAAAEKLVKSACLLEIDCAPSLLAAGDALRRVGAPERALSYYEQSVRRDLTLDNLMRVADAASALGDYGRAARALTQAAIRSHGDPTRHAEIERRRQHIFRGTVGR